MTTKTKAADSKAATMWKIYCDCALVWCGPKAPTQEDVKKAADYAKRRQDCDYETWPMNLFCGSDPMWFIRELKKPD